jgi:hypothetical protein
VGDGDQPFTQIVWQSIVFSMWTSRNAASCLPHDSRVIAAYRKKAAFLMKRSCVKAVTPPSRPISARKIQERINRIRVIDGAIMKAPWDSKGY